MYFVTNTNISFRTHSILTTSACLLYHPLVEHARVGLLYIWPAQACASVTVVLLDPLSGLT